MLLSSRKLSYLMSRNQRNCAPTSQLEMNSVRETNAIKSNGNALGARELGILRKRSPVVSNNGVLKKIKTGQIFSHLVVLDFESTCWKEDKYRSQEIIEFPAVLLNTQTGEVEAEFQYYVQPQEHPTLSEFCKELTGISQSKVDDGIPIRLCLKLFANWLNKLQHEKGLYFRNTQETSEHPQVVLVTWSDWDLGVCLQYECKRKQLLKPVQLNYWIDLRATYRNFYDRKPNGLNGALQDLGIHFEGRQHSGLDDAKNTARLAWRMISDGCIMRVTKTLKAQSESRNNIENKGPASNIFSASSTTKQPSRQSFSNGNKKISCQFKLGNGGRQNCTKEGDKDRIQIYEDPVDHENGYLQKMSGQTNAGGLKLQTNNMQNVPQRSPSKLNDPLVRKMFVDSCQFKASKPAEIESTKSDSTNIIQSANTVSMLNTPVSRVNRNILLKEQSSKTSPVPGFKTPSPPTVHQKGQMYTSNQVSKSTGDGRILAMSRQLPNKHVSKSVFLTPKLPHSNTTNMKSTPPLCSCGRRSKRHLVQNPGPNVGRWFFSCSVGRRNSTGSTKTGCQFFKWESSVSPRSKHSVSLYKPFTPVMRATSVKAFTDPLKRNLGPRTVISSFR